MLSKIKSFAKKDKIFFIVLAKTFIARIFSALGAIFLSLILARIAGPNELGVYTTLMTILYVLAIIGRFGMDSVFLVYGSLAISKKNFNEYLKIKKSLYLVMILFILIFSGVFILLVKSNIEIYFFNGRDMEDEFLVGALIALGFNSIYFQSACLKCLGKPEITPIIEIGAVSFFAAIFVLIAHILGYEMTVKSCLYATLGSTLLVLAGGYIFINRYEKNIIFKKTFILNTGVIKFIKEGFDHMLSNLTAFLVQWSSLIILALYASAEDVGVFSLTQRLAMLTTFILSVFNSIASNRFVILSRESNPLHLHTYVRKTTNYMFISGIFVTLLVTIFSKNILSAFGKEFVVGWPYLIVLNIGQLVNVATGSVGALLNMSGHQKAMRNILIMTGIFSSGLSFFLISMIGLWGAVIGTFVNVTFQNISASYYAFSKLKIKTYPH